MKVVGAVLAGGKSSRMGRDKAGVMIPSGDDAAVTLGARAVAVLREVCDDVVVLGHGRGMPSDVARIDDAVDARGEPVGPLGGILALLRSKRGQRYVVLPVDMPGVESQHVRSLLSLLAPAPPPLRSSKSADFDEHGVERGAQNETKWRARGAAACLAVDDVIEPLPIAIANVDVARDEVERLLARGERSMKALIAALAPLRLSLSITDRAVIRNVNTLADFDDGPSAKLGQ